MVTVINLAIFYFWLPCKVWPVGVKVVSSGCNVKLDLVEFIKIVDNVSSEVGLEEGTPGIIPVTAWQGNKWKNMREDNLDFTPWRQNMCIRLVKMLLMFGQLSFIESMQGHRAKQQNKVQEQIQVWTIILKSVWGGCFLSLKSKTDPQLISSWCCW